MKTRPSLATGSHGQSIVEFAIVLPLVLVLAMGVIEAGYALLDQHVVTKLSREGANLISRDATLQDAAAVLRNMSSRPVDFANGSTVIFSVVKKGGTTGTTNYNQMVLYQRYQYGTLSATSAVRTAGGGSFGGPPNYEAANSDGNAGLRITAGVPTNLVTAPGGLIYIAEIFTRHTLITPFDRLGISIPTTLYSIAYF